MARTAVATDDFSTDTLATNYENGPGNLGLMAVTGGVIRAAAPNVSSGCYRSDTLTADQYSIVTVGSLATDSAISAICRGQTGTEELYAGAWNDNSGAWQIQYFSAAGVPSILASLATGFVSAQAGDSLRLECEGTTLRLYTIVSGVETLRISMTDTTLSSGLAGAGAAGIGAVTDAQITSLEIGNITAGGTTREVDGNTESLTITAQKATVGRGRGVPADAETLAVSAQPATVSRDRGVSGSTESLSLTAQDATVDRGRGVSAGTESLALTAQGATVSRARGVTALAEALSLTGQQATVQRGAARSIVAATEALSLVGQPATVGRGRGVQALLASFQLSGFRASFGEPETIGGHFWQPDNRAERDEKRLREKQELRELIERAAGLIEASEEVAEAAEEAGREQPGRFIPRPAFKSQVADLKAELAELREQAEFMRPDVDDSRDRIKRIVTKATDDIIVRIAGVLTDIIQEIVDEA